MGVLVFLGVLGIGEWFLGAMWKDKNAELAAPYMTEELHKMYPFSSLAAESATDVVLHMKRIGMGPGYTVWSYFQLPTIDDMDKFQRSILVYGESNYTSASIEIDNVMRPRDHVERVPESIKSRWISISDTTGTHIRIFGKGEYMEWFLDEGSLRVLGLCTD